ncbi:response regulator [Actinoplanes sp. TRM 88003]|uniref:Response regulator n=1 Tax=Paractinoplanes aksuensis TaxID=2939490 RepID=A0ABT1DH62_9ACTN|nr:response regulator [Actinoplanes aksuensis]MCO8269833.1 response regulator [Actinoplanes aksuensis]
MWNTSAPQQGPVVLLVEDDEDLRDMTSQMLELRGFQVLVATDAVTAITKCKVHEGKIDVLLTDLGLPGVSGGELARSAHAVRPGMETVYISGMPQEIAIRRGIIKRGASFIAKPFTADQLAGTLRSVLAQHNSNAPAP